jgi:cell division protein FtsZ
MELDDSRELTEFDDDVDLTEVENPQQEIVDVGNRRTTEAKPKSSAKKKRRNSGKESTSPVTGFGIRERKIKRQMAHTASIKIIGVGGAGGNAVNRMIEAGLEGVEYIAANTDLQALSMSMADHKIQLGPKCTRGLGAGGDAETGLKAAMESKAEISEALEDSVMVFITAGMGGGTGTGAAPIIAEISKEKGALTIGVVTKPFTFEGFKRRHVAERGIENLRDSLDALITIPNDKLLEVINEETTMLESFSIADDVLRQGVQGISDLIVKPGVINLDFADVEAVMKDAGTALIGMGYGTAANRAIDAVRMAIASPLLETNIEGAKRILINFTGSDVRLNEVNQAADEIYAISDNESNIIFGTSIDNSIKDEIRVTILATDFINAESEPTIPIKEGLMGSELSSDSSDSDNTPPDIDSEVDYDIPSFIRKGNYKD